MINYKMFFYKLFYDKTAKKTMMIMENCEAFNIYKQTLINNEKLIEKKLQRIISDLEINRDNAVSSGQFKCNVATTNKLNKKQIKYLKKYYKNKGYKIRFGSSDSLMIIDKISISWKHWR